ncbi:MAG: PHP domain-containing protein [Jatrophihabitans sp.]
MAAPSRDPVDDLRRIAFLLERSNQPSYRVKAFRGAAATLTGLLAGELAERAGAGTLRELPGIGEKTAAVIAESIRGEEPAYLRRVEDETGGGTKLPTGDEARTDERAVALRAALRGDCHTHSDWSDGGSPIDEMADTARRLGHDYVVLTDHSPRLTVARGLTAERLEQQLEVVSALNEQLAPFRILTGIEVDILDDGSLDQSDELLGRVDVVVASVHSKLKMAEMEMTQRMVGAIANPHTDILGHCTGRLVTGGRGTRPESQFDAEIVFAACERFGVAVEINSRPERQDPPKRLLRLAVELGCLFSIDTDAHAPGQLDWQLLGCARAVDCEVPTERVVNTWAEADLLAWAADHWTLPS